MRLTKPVIAVLIVLALVGLYFSGLAPGFNETIDDFIGFKVDDDNPFVEPSNNDTGDSTFDDAYPFVEGWSNPKSVNYMRLIFEPERNTNQEYYYYFLFWDKTASKSDYHRYESYDSTIANLKNALNAGKITQTQYDCGKAQYDATKNFPDGWNSWNTKNHICINNVFNNQYGAWSISYSTYLSPYYNYRTGTSAYGVEGLLYDLLNVRHTITQTQYDCGMAQIALLKGGASQ